MVNPTNFWIAWGVYLFAAVVFCVFFWRITRSTRYRILVNCLRAVMLAIIFTPWYVSETEPVMAPALIIVLMDAITISGTAAVRAFVPLFLTVVLALMLALVFMLIARGRRKRREAKAES